VGSKSLVSCKLLALAKYGLVRRPFLLGQWAFKLIPDISLIEILLKCFFPDCLHIRIIWNDNRRRIMELHLDDFRRLRVPALDISVVASRTTSFGFLIRRWPPLDTIAA